MATTYTGIPDGMLRHEYQVSIRHFARIRAYWLRDVLDGDQAEIVKRCRSSIYLGSNRVVLNPSWPQTSWVVV